MKNLKCPFCKSDKIVEENNTTVIKQGIHKITIPADNYKCLNCKRNFVTQEQKQNADAVHHAKKSILPMRDMRNR